MATLPKAVQGATHTPQPIIWKRVDQTRQDLTDVTTFTGKIRHLNGVVRDIEGNLIITDAAQGEFTWDFADEDVETAGEHVVQFTATYADGVDITFLAKWEVEEAL